MYSAAYPWSPYSVAHIIYHHTRIYYAALPYTIHFYDILMSVRTLYFHNK